MNRMTTLKWVNPILGLLIVSQILTGLLGHQLPRDWFIILHKGGGFFCAGVALVHLYLNWNWVKTTYFRPPPG